MAEDKEKKKIRKKKWDLLNVEKNKQYRILNRDRINQKRREWRKLNKERDDKYNKDYYKRIKERDKEKRRIIDKKNKSHKYKNNIEFKILCNIRSRLRRSIKDNKKSDRTINLLGCSISEFKFYIESKFTEGMNWGNHGIKGWHLDHIIPCDIFDLTKKEAQKFCFHYTNYQPLWMTDNVDKSNNIDIELLKTIDKNLLKEKYRKLFE